MNINDGNFEFKSKLLLVYAILCTLLLVANVVNWDKSIYRFFDNIFNPTLISFRNSSNNFNYLIHEMNNKDEVLRENIDLKRKLIKYEEVEVINKNLLEQIAKLEAQTNIEKISDKKLQIVDVIGAQNIFSSNPELIIRKGSKQGIQVNDTVFYESNSLLGYVVEVYEETSKVLPFYSPNIGFKIPAKNLRLQDQKGFITPIRNGQIKIINIPLNVEILEGDIWITTNDFPGVIPNLILGRAKVITKNTETGFQEVILEVGFDFNKTNYVFVEE